MRDQPIRRFAAAIVLVGAIGALVATSPPSAPISDVRAEASRSIDLTAEQSVASVHLTVVASDEALWSDDPEIEILEAGLDVSARGVWKHARESSSTPPDTRSAALDVPNVRLRLLTANGDVGDSLSRINNDRVDLLSMCQEDLDCVVEIEAIVEWVGPVAERAVAVSLEMTAESRIQGPEDVPSGATLGIEAAELVATDAAVLSDAVTGSATLDIDHPMVTWTIDVDASGDAVPSDGNWPIESRGTFVASAAALGGADDESDSQGQGPPVQLMMLSDTGQLMDIASSQFDPFNGCTTGVPCDRSITIIARWFAQDQAAAAQIDWKLDAGLVYHGDELPRPGALVRATVREEIAIGPDGPSLNATIEGTIEFDATEGGLRASDEISLTIPREALSSALVGGPVPAINGLLTIEGDTAEATTADLQPLLIRWGPPETFADPSWRFPEPQPNGDPVTAVVFPGVGCHSDQSCSANLTIEAGVIANDLEALTGNAITVRWQLRVTLNYPAGTTLPPGLEIGLDL